MPKGEQVEEGRPARRARALGSLVESTQAFEVLVESFGLCAMVLDGAPVSADELLGLVQIFELLIALLPEFFQVAAVVVGVDEVLETMVETRSENSWNFLARGMATSLSAL